jgi:hypothetical protein
LDKPVKVEQTTLPVLDRNEVLDDVKIAIEVDKASTAKQENLRQLLQPKIKKTKKTPKKEAKSLFASLSDTLSRKRKRTQKKNWDFY